MAITSAISVLAPNSGQDRFGRKMGASFRRGRTFNSMPSVSACGVKRFRPTSQGDPLKKLSSSK